MQISKHLIALCQISSVEFHHLRASVYKSMNFNSEEIKGPYTVDVSVLLVVMLLPSAGRYGIMLACWQGEPKERPTFPALVQILGDLLQDNSLPVSPQIVFSLLTDFRSWLNLEPRVLQDGKDYVPLNSSQSSEDDGFSQVSSRPPSEEELRLACNSLPNRYLHISLEKLGKWLRASSG